MAVYPQLLLSAGGGIISSKQQSEQMQDTATLIIGLGGTGMDALRTLKTQVYARLRPDDPKAVIPSYQHIRFLGIDTDTTMPGDSANAADNTAAQRNGIISLAPNEFFGIDNSDIRRAVQSKNALSIRPEMSWFNAGEIQAGDLGDAGAGGIRQVGRFMLMDKSAELMAKIRTEINTAKEGLTDARVMIHVLSGLSGGTGSGCFLDLCYMLRGMAHELGACTIFGYFFLPDVNLAKIPEALIHVRQYIPKNGYAAMQELDYCMNLPDNGGSFSQRYGDGRTVDWNQPPVDMCHLVCATDAGRRVIPNAYNYAMNVTAEYIMDFLTKCEDQDFQLTQHLSNFRRMVGNGDDNKAIGSNLAYCVIGASCASIPLREINTYLAAQLFGRFARICQNAPSEQDVLQLLADSVAPGSKTLADIYDGLYRTLRTNADDEFSIYTQGHKYVAQYGDGDMVEYYSGLLAQKTGAMKSNAASMIDEKNDQSLVGAIMIEMSKILRDVFRGPIFGYRMLAAAESHNLLNLIDGLMSQNQSLLEQALYSRETIRQYYESARADFMNKPSGFGAEKRYNNYIAAITQEVQIVLEVDTRKALGAVLGRLREQIIAVTGGYYIKLARVTQNLVETFAENYNALASGQGNVGTYSFATPMMTIEELKPALDRQIEELDIPNMMDAFMTMLLSDPDAWITEDEYKIARAVTDFFVETAFSSFAGMTITAFLSNKYGTTSNEELTNRIHDEWIQTLTRQAEPLFCFDTAIWSLAKSTRMCAISVPQTAAPIVASAQKKVAVDPQWKVKKTALTDRIFVLHSACVLPLSAYGNCEAYEQSYFNSIISGGGHYYEGKPMDGTPFTDWRKLPSLTPSQLVNLDRMPADIKARTEAAMALYAAAAQRGLFSDDGTIRVPDPTGMTQVRGLLDQWKAFKSSAQKTPQEVPTVQQMQAALEAARNVPLVDSPYKMRVVGTKEAQEKVCCDLFVAAPVYQMVVQQAMEDLSALDTLVGETLGDMAQCAQSWLEGVRKLSDYFNALFTGVITMDGLTIFYRQNEFGITTDHPLSNFDPTQFPFASIPFYQGYKSFEALPDNIRQEIQTAVASRLGVVTPEVTAACAVLKTALADDRIAFMAQSAANFVERPEILDFLKRLKQEFISFCGMRGIV